MTAHNQTILTAAGVGCLFAILVLQIVQTINDERPVVIVADTQQVRAIDGGARSVKFWDPRESMPGGAGGVDDGQRDGAISIVDDALPSGVLTGEGLAVTSSLGIKITAIVDLGQLLRDKVCYSSIQYLHGLSERITYEFVSRDTDSLFWDESNNGSILDLSADGDSLIWYDSATWWRDVYFWRGPQ